MRALFLVLFALLLTACRPIQPDLIAAPVPTAEHALAAAGPAIASARAPKPAVIAAATATAVPSASSTASTEPRPPGEN